MIVAAAWLIIGVLLLTIAWLCIAEPVLDARAALRRQEARDRWLASRKGTREGEISNE